ncbi:MULTISPECIES: cytochrome P450 [unclassified Bradyrhizobium]|uniref:cytochrome P450 n=1 Tax=unclassified Bradyrhizobium TaxID=2631580 RepID=UPI0028E6EF5E|nr:MULTISPECIES: cytochrome P450 [unclassified Bradyrhizobium]
MINTAIYRPIDADTIADPFSVFAELRKAAPILWHEELKSWVLSRHADCQEVLRNHIIFARDPRRVGIPMREERRNIQTEDPPEQKELRRIMIRALHHQDIDGICADARRRFQTAVLDMDGTGPFNLMKLAAQAAMEIINTIVGSVQYEAASYYPIFRDLTRAMDSGLDRTRLEAGVAAGTELSEAVRTWFTATPDSGMLAELKCNDAVRNMPAYYVNHTLGGVFNAGFSTLYASIGSISLLLLQRPEALDQLRGKTLVATGVDELLRFTSPAQATSRFAVYDTTLGGITIKAGSTIVTLMAAANRDPSVFECPDDLEVERDPNPHLAFAWGPHICLGAQLARVWTAEIVRFLQEVRGTIQIVEEPIYMDSATLRNIVDLKVEVRR